MLAAVAFVIAATLAAAAPENCALVVVPSSSLGMPVVVRIDFAEVARAEGMKSGGLVVRPADVRAALVEDGRLVPVPCQYDPTGDATGQLTLSLPPSEHEQRVAVFFTATGPHFGQPPVSGTLRIEQREGAIVVENGFARVTHDPAHQAGLPSRIEFTASGKVFGQFNNNDRVWDKGRLGGFWLRNCPDAKVELVVRGPLRAVVRVTAYYAKGDGTRPDSKPQAVYEYSYFAGSPFILLHAQVSQQQRFEWSELHIVEINFPGADFTRWVLPDEAGKLASDKSSHRGVGWAGLADEAGNVLAVVAQQCIIYDGRKDYGTYLHGPWVSWDGLDESFDVALYAAGDTDALARLNGTSPAKMRPRTARVSTPQLEKALDELRQMAVRGKNRWAWVAALLQRMALTRLADAAGLARSAVAAARQGKDAHRWMVRARWPYVFIAGSRAGLAFERDGGGVRLVSLFDLKHRRETMSPNQAAFWALQAEDANGQKIGADSNLPAQKCERVAGGREIRMRWLPLRELGRKDGDRMVVEMTFRAEGPEITATMHIDNRSALTLAEIAWPQIYAGPLGERAEDDVLLEPVCSGRLCFNPAVAAHARRKTLYPNGWVDMQVLALYDRHGGLVFMCQDPLASAKHVEWGPERGGVRMAFVWPAPDYTRAGNDFDPPGRIAMHLYDGDWYDAAMVYRGWVSREAKWWPQRSKQGRPDTPQWMRDLPVWALASGPPQQVVPRVKKFREYVGVPCGLHWYNWHQIPFDNDYPHYFPTKPGFPEGVRELQAAGVRVMPYINGRLWDSDTPDFKTKALPFATKDRAGNYYVEVYGSGEKLVPMCPTTRLWQRTVQGIVKRLVGPEYNVDGVYIDQVAAARPRMCYDATHGHPLAGGHWWTTQGYWPMLSKLQADLARDFPDKMLTTECTAECYTHVFDGYLSWHWQENNAVPFYPAVYGDKIRLFSRAYRYRGDKALVFRMRLAQQFVFGEQLWWSDPDIWKDEQIGPYLRRLAKIRWALRDYFRGRLLRPPAVEGDVADVTGDWAWHGKTIVTMKAVQASAFRAEDGRVAVVVTNHFSEPQTFTLRLPVREYGVPRDAAVTWIGEDGTVSRQPDHLSGGVISVTLQPGEAYGLLLSGVK